MHCVLDVRQRNCEKGIVYTTQCGSCSDHDGDSNKEKAENRLKEFLISS